MPLPSSVEFSSPRSWMEYVRELEPSYVPDPRDLASSLEEIGDVLAIGAVIVVRPGRRGLALVGVQYLIPRPGYRYV